MPIEIKPGALGNGQPARILLVSPQHRMLIESADGPVLGPAKALLRAPGVRQRKSTDKVIYYCLLFDGHEIIFAQDAATESFRPGTMGLSGFDNKDLRKIMALYPGILEDNDKSLGPPARPIVTRRDAERIICTAKKRHRRLTFPILQANAETNLLAIAST